MRWRRHPLEQAGITPDPDNARLHTPRNIDLIEDSMQTDGAGRSILVDQHGVTIAGAGAWEAATQAGIQRAAVIETDGDTLVVVKRTVTPDQRLRLALADNRATELSTWDAGRLRQLQVEAPELLKNLWTEQELVQLFASVTCDRHDGLTDPDASRRNVRRRSSVAIFLRSERIGSCAVTVPTQQMSRACSPGRSRR